MNPWKLSGRLEISWRKEFLQPTKVGKVMIILDDADDDDGDYDDDGDDDNDDDDDCLTSLYI